MKREKSETFESIFPPEIGQSRIISRWSNDELMLAVRGISEFGKSFQAIADFLGTKSEAHVRTFFVNYRRKYNLDAIVKQFETQTHQRQKDIELRDNETSISMCNDAENASFSNKSSKEIANIKNMRDVLNVSK